MSDLNRKFTEMMKRASSNNSVVASSIAAGSCASMKKEEMFSSRKLMYVAIAAAVAAVIYYGYRWWQRYRLKQEQHRERARADDNKHDGTEWDQFFAAQEDVLQKLPSTDASAGLSIDTGEASSVPSRPPAPTPTTARRASAAASEDPKFTKLQ